MPDLDNNDPAAPQALAENMAVLREAKANRALAPKVEAERRREIRKRLKDEAAGLTAAMKAAQKKESARLRKQKSRAKLAGDIAATLADLPPEPAVALDRQSLEYDRAALDKFLARPGHVPGAVRRLEARRPGETMLCREHLLLMRTAGGGIEPTHAAFAERLSSVTDRPWSRDQARRALELQRRLEERGGPFGV